MNEIKDQKVLGVISFFAIITLLWLFQSFLLVLVFACIYAISTNPLCNFFAQKLSKTHCSLLMCFLTVLFVIVPLIYLISTTVMAISSELPAFIAKIKSIDFDLLSQNLKVQISSIPIIQNLNFDQFNFNNYAGDIQAFLSYFSKSILNFSLMLTGSFSIVASLLLFIFILFFLYKDGDLIALKLKYLLPTSRFLSEKIAVLFESLCAIYLFNFIVVALIQGIGFGFIVSFFNLPAYYFGLLFLLASFIPIIGTAIIWIPTVIYLFLLGNQSAALIITLYCVFVSGILIDYFLRAVLVEKISSFYPSQNIKPSSLVITLSTLAGVIKFGILGLILGPLLATAALSLIYIYIENK